MSKWPKRVQENKKQSDSVACEQNEHEFHSQQAKLRALERVKNRRDTKFDYFVLALSIFKGEQVDLSDLKQEFLSGLNSPDTFLENCSTSELLALESSVNVMMSAKEDLEYWKSVLDLCRWKLRTSSDNGEFLDSSTLSEIEAFLASKPMDELKKLSAEIENVCSSGKSDYWELMFLRTNSCIAKQFLDNLASTHTAKPVKKQRTAPEESPPLLPTEDFPPDSLVLTEEENENYILDKRTSALQEIHSKMKMASRNISKGKPGSQKSGLYSVFDTETAPRGSLEETADGLLALEVAKKQEDEEDFDNAVEINQIIENWHQKYRPRKPKYINRIKTGYEWTKHNQTHYDSSNPPPKVVQGYKFNIFYPHLIDKNTAPQYYLEPGKSNDVCIIRFHAGPPYEDIAFEIVNREWDFSERNGFRSFFEKGILHLYFNFKRHRFKR